MPLAKLASIGVRAFLTAVALTPAVGWTQTGTLQVPAHPPANTAPPKPAPAPRTPVQQVGSPTTPPVVQPHGPPRPANPPRARQPRARAAAPLPIPPIPPATAPSAAQPAPEPVKPEEPEKGSATGLKLPRFAALRTDDVNMRAGPGTRYPIEWVYKRRDMPVEIEREFEVWRLVRDPDGTRGWVHTATLTGRRTFEVQGADATLRSAPKDDASAVADLKVGVIGRIRSCEADAAWCQVQVGDYRGFLKRTQFWGTLSGEAVSP